MQRMQSRSSSGKLRTSSTALAHRLRIRAGRHNGRANFVKTTEEKMASSAHFYLNWAKERIDEMDAVLGSLEGKATQIATESRAAAEKIISEMREKRDAFSSDMKKQVEAG